MATNTKMTVYCCGGTGANIGKRIGDLDINVVYVDTSDSNLRGINSSNQFLVEGMDGAGKNRIDTYEAFKEIVPDILLRFPASEHLNVVLASFSGGSGGVISTMLASELIKSGKNTIVIGVESEQSTRELDNAFRALKSFKGASAAIKKPISLFYINGESRNDADKRALHFISLLGLLIDKRHTAEFDNADLKSFLFYDRVTDNAPSVTMIELVPNEPFEAERGTSVVGTILVTDDPESEIQPVYPEYKATCIVRDTAPGQDGKKFPDIRINSVLGKFTLIYDNLEKRLKQHADTKHLNKVKDIVVEDAGSDGMVV